MRAFVLGVFHIEKQFATLNWNTEARTLLFRVSDIISSESGFSSMLRLTQ